MKKITLIIITLFTIHDLLAQQLVEQVVKSANFYDIPFTKYKLDNGLTIILHQDTTVSNVYVNMLYKVGSINELQGKTGYAHFFEHLMFAGTKTLSKKDIWELFPKTNSTMMNAGTSYDYTMYEEEVPANYLERSLWLESQRLRFTPEFMNEDNVSVQKQIILNELIMRTEDDLSGILDKNIDHLLFNEKHPLHHPIAGYKEDIQRAKLEDIRGFFQKWYVPNNAILTVTGNMDIKNTLAWIKKYFADIPKQALPESKLDTTNTFQVSCTKDLYYDINFPIYTITFPTVSRWSNDEAPLDALSYILMQTDNPESMANEFRKILSKTIDINIVHPCIAYGGEFKIAFRTKELTENPQDLVMDAFKFFNRKRFLPENIDEYKTYFQNTTYQRFQTIRLVGINLAQYELLLNTPNGLPTEWKSHMSLTGDQIMKVFRTYLYNKPFVSVNILPYADKQKTKGKKKIKNINVEELERDILWNDIDENTLNKTDSNAFVPQPQQQTFSKFNSWKGKLDNNIEVYGTTGNINIPISTLSINIKAGLLYNQIEYAGLSQFYANILNGIIHWNISYNLKNIGASATVVSNDEDLVIHLTFPDKHINYVAKLVDSMLFYIKIDPVKYVSYMDFYHNIVVENYKENAFLTTNAMLKKAFYSPSNLLSYTPFGSKKTVKNNFSALSFMKEIDEMLETNTQIYYVGNLPIQTVVDGIAILGSWITDTSKKISNLPLSEQPTAISFFLNNKVDATQSNIDIGIKTLTNKSINNYTTLQIINYILGESFTGRLNTKLREEKGLAYYCYSYIPNSLYDDILHIRTNININETDKAITILIKELNNFIENGITEAELQKAKVSMMAKINEVPQTTELKIAELEDFANLATSPIVYYNKRQQLIKAANTTYINQFIKDYFKPNTYQIAIVSDKLKVLPQLQKLNYKITDYTDKLY